MTVAHRGRRQRASVQSIALSLAVAILCSTARLDAELSTTAPGSLVVFPYVVADSAAGLDTLLRLGNAGDRPLRTRCVYEDTIPRCAGGRPGESCIDHAPPCSGDCQPQTQDREFTVILTGRQPIEWRASIGLSDFALDGNRSGPGGQSNQGSLIPPVRTDPFRGLLRCVVLDERGNPAPRNDLLGSAVVEQRSGSPQRLSDLLRYNPFSFSGLPQNANRDFVLTLGGPAAEYDACPQSLLLQHLFDGAVLRFHREGTDIERKVSNHLVVARCGSSTLEPSTIDVEVYNEFEQRLAARLSIEPYVLAPLSALETERAERSIFHVATQGTLAGQSYLRAQAGDPAILALAIATQHDLENPERRSSTALEPVISGARGDQAVVRLDGAGAATPTSTTFPPGATPTSGRQTPCAGDCDGRGVTTIDELVRGVSIALGADSPAGCSAFDLDQDGRVTVDELTQAVVAALQGCP